MKISTIVNGHRITLRDGKWYYDDGVVYDGTNKRPCPKCGRHQTEDGYDACLGKIEGAKAACCGHGDESKRYIKWGE